MSLTSGNNVPPASAAVSSPGPGRTGNRRLVVIGGLPGTGKSTLALRLGEALDAVVLHSDEVRRRVARLSPAAHSANSFGQGMFSPEMTELTYREMLTLARSALGDGKDVVIDASWHDPAWRDQVRSLASEASASLVELRCWLPLETIAERVTGQAVARGNAAGETLALVRMLAASQHPWPSALTVNTAADPDVVADYVLRELAGGPARHGT